MATPVYVNDADQTEQTLTTHTITLTGVTSGNLLILSIMNASDQRAQPTITDYQSNSWTYVDYQSGGNSEAIGMVYAEAGSSGDVQVSIEFGGNEDIATNLLEISGHDSASPLDTSDWLDGSSSTTTHYCANVGNIDTTTDVFVVAIGITTANFGTFTTPLDADIFGPTDESFVSYKTSASALTNERGQFDGTNNRFAVGMIASFKGAAGGGATIPIFDHHYRSLRSA